MHDCCVKTLSSGVTDFHGKKVLYLSSFYRRGDLALRIGLFYTAASLSGAFGGKKLIYHECDIQLT